MTDMPDTVTLEGARVRYPAARSDALDGVSLSVAAGARIGVAGRTGAGKSTLALLAAGFIPRVVRATVEGRATLGTTDLAKAESKDLLGRVGIVFATPANQLSASKLTVREELAFGLENLAVPRDQMDGRIDQVLARLGIGHLADREPFALSGGEQQRVAIASIVTMGTDVLILDEPTAQLDPAGSEAIADLLAELARDGVAVLCVEHDPAVLRTMDRVAVLEAGRLTALDTPGRALGTAALPEGLEPPTLVRLAEAAGADPARAFDEPFVAAALAAHKGSWPTEGRGQPTALAWKPVRDRPPLAVELDDVAFSYPSGVEALRSVSLHVEPGETVAIVGQNGSGKTTLVKQLNGLLRPTRGRVLLGGSDAATEPISRIAEVVGFVFQSPDDQLFERSVEREVSFGPRRMGLPPETVSQLVEQAVELAGLGAVRTTNPYDLDLSTRKLVGLASVLATDPAVVVLDEPTTGQDGPGVARVGRIVDALRASGKSVVAITHDMEFAAAHFGRIVVMRQGEVAADGPPATVFGPANVELLASTGLRPPAAARVAAAIGLPVVPARAEELLELLARRA
jgi:energy-coupling factor transport system ATP-binding protein